MMLQKQRFFALITLISLVHHVAEASYSVSVRSGKTKCFTVRTPKSNQSKFSGHFELIDEVLPADPLSFSITSIDEEEPHYEAVGEYSGGFHFTSVGAYKICIGNGIGGVSDRETRKVGFTIRVKTVNPPHEDSPGPLTEQLTMIDDLADDLLFHLEELLDHIELQTERERDHRDVTEKTFRNVWVWTLIEKLVLILISVGQVMYIRFYMSRKSGL